MYIRLSKNVWYSNTEHPVLEWNMDLINHWTFRNIQHPWQKVVLPSFKNLYIISFDLYGFTFLYRVNSAKLSSVYQTSYVC